jgi:hypothetical protein
MQTPTGSDKGDSIPAGLAQALSLLSATAPPVRLGLRSRRARVSLAAHSCQGDFRPPLRVLPSPKRVAGDNRARVR